MPISARVVVVCGLLSIAFGGAPVGAEPIDVTVPITSGSVSFSPSTGSGTSPLQLYGDGFSFVAGPQFGATGPGCCLAPGSTTFFRASWSGNDLLGTVTFNGETFPNVGSLASSNTASVNFVSSPFTLPSADGSASVTITAPFTLSGSFSGAPTTGNALPTVKATLVGSGTGTILFTLFSTGPFTVWEPRMASLQIGATDAVPEPSSILLVCLSLAGVYAATRRRRPALQ
jgi:hypothetical protein